MAARLRHAAGAQLSERERRQRPAVLAVRIRAYRGAAVAGIRPVVSHPAHQPRRGISAGCACRGLAACPVGIVPGLPVASQAAADLSLVPGPLALDWFYLFWQPLMYATSAGAVWTLVAGATLLLFVLPALPHAAAAPVAEVHPDNCNGCRRCFEDCPYAAIVMVPHPDGMPGRQLAQVIPDLCASCGICAGACPSSTPFRSGPELVTGIDMPQMPIGGLRQALQRGLAHLEGKNGDCRVRLRSGRGCGKSCRQGPRKLQPDLHRHAAALIRRIRAARRRRRRAGDRLPRGRLRTSAWAIAGPRSVSPERVSRICAPARRASALRIAWADRGEETRACRRAR